MENVSKPGGTVNHAAPPTAAATRMQARASLHVVAVTVMVLGITASQVAAATWSRAYIRRLPDSAFAVIETTPEGRLLRRLPHHDAAGALDLPHVCNALARLPQVRWRDPARAETARRHLQDHLSLLGRSACRPATRTAGDLPAG